jgi:cell division control protein 6
MQKFFEDTPPSSSIISREEVLLPVYQPDELRYRGNELQAMADAVKPLLRRRESTNLVIHGKSGTGKTSCAKAILRQISEHSPVVLPVYVNCWESPTRAAVFGRIIEAMRLPVPRRGLAADEVFDRVLQYAKNYSRPILLVLDELDGLEEEELLYSVARANERQGILFGIIGITNNPAFLAKLDPRVRSSLRFSELRFSDYSEEQLFWILKDRAIAGLGPGTWDEKLLTKIANGVDEGSARIALEKLWKAARHAEDLGKPKITLQDLADSEAEAESAVRPGAALTDMESKIVERLRNGSRTTDELYELLNSGKTKRMFMNYLSRLEEKKIIRMEAQPETGAEGKFRPKVCSLESGL